MRLRAAVFVLCPALVLAQAKPAAISARAATKPVSATITDTKGATAEVSDLRARYWDERQGDHRLDPDDIPALVLELVIQEDRVSATEPIRYALADLAKRTRLGNYEFELVRRNGNVVSVSPLRGAAGSWEQRFVLVERAPSGQLVTERKFREYAVATRKQDGEVLGAAVMRRMRLGGFTGKARMSSGRTGDYFINWSEVRTIEFR